MKRVFFFLTIVFFFFYSCKKEGKSDCPLFTGYSLPPTFYFILKKDNQRLPDSVLNNLRLYYLTDNAKAYVQDFGRAGSDGYNLGAMITRDIGFKSADNNIKSYYLEFQNNDVDTLFVDYKRYSVCEADTSSCYCLYPRFSVKYNGQEAGYDPSVLQQAVYLFNVP